MDTAGDNGHWVGPRLRLLPILLVFVLGYVALQVAFLGANQLMRHLTPSVEWPTWLTLVVAEAFELILALVGIGVAGQLLPKADFGLRWPPGRTYLGWAIFWGLAFALIMLVADHWPELIHLKPPPTAEPP